MDSITIEKWGPQKLLNRLIGTNTVDRLQATPSFLHSVQKDKTVIENRPQFLLKCEYLLDWPGQTLEPIAVERRAISRCQN